MGCFDEGCMGCFDEGFMCCFDEGFMGCFDEGFMGCFDVLVMMLVRNFCSKFLQNFSQISQKSFWESFICDNDYVQ